MALIVLRYLKIRPFTPDERKGRWMEAPRQARSPLAWLQHGKREVNDPFDLLGDVLDGQFRVDSLVGEGELSVVYKGQHLGVDAPVAIKCLNLPETLHPALATPLVQGFKEASRVHYRLARGNLHIAQAIASGSTIAPRTGTSIHYLVREWFDGEPLATELARRRKESKEGRTLDETLALLETAFEAVSYAHAQGEAHLALNPTNLFLARNANNASAPTLKVLDFGTAGTMGALGAAATPSSTRPPPGLRLMLPAYAAPEQLERSVGKPGPWTDVYALALVMLEVLSDRIVMNTSDTGVLVERALDAQRRPTPQSHGLKLPSQVDRALARAVARAPEARQGNAAELWREVSRSTSVISLPRAAPQLPRPFPARPSLRVVPDVVQETRGPGEAEPVKPVASSPPTEPLIRAATIADAPSAATPVTEAPVNSGPVTAGPVTAGPVTSEPIAPAEPETEAAATPQAVWVAPLGRPRAAPLKAVASTVKAWVELLKPRISKVHAVVLERSAFCVATCRHFVSTRPRSAILVGANITVLLLAAVLWRHKSSRDASIAASSASASADPSPPTVLADEPVDPAVSVPPSSPFNIDLAMRALDRKWRAIAKCRRGKEWGKVWTTVTFAEDGSVSNVAVAAPMAGTATGQCIVDTLSRVRVPRFDDGPAPIDYRVYVAPR
jgi:serine/threonine protein kinase